MRRLVCRPAIIILLWTILATLFVGFNWTDRISNFPPAWDGLAYQTLGLQLLSNFRVLSQYSEGIIPWGWLGIIASGFFAFGRSPWSMVIVGAIFFYLFLLGTFLVMSSCRISKGLSLTLLGLISIFPTILYQNLLQTRNDYSMASCFAVSIYFFLKARQLKDQRLFFISGLVFGLGTLIKLSAPGYLIFSFVFYSVGFLGGGQKLKQRAQSLSYFAMGFFLVAGPIYATGLKQTLSYYKYWASMTKWISDQYGLSSTFDRILFYPKNLVNYHLWLPSQMVLWLFVILMVLSLSYVFFSSTNRKKTIQDFITFEVAFVASLWFLPLVFLTFGGSLAQVGDIPVLPFLFATLGAILSPGWDWVEGRLNHLRSRKFAIFASIVILSGTLFWGAKSIRIEEPSRGADYRQFVEKLNSLREEYRLSCDRAYALFSHPYYSFDSALWYRLLRSEQSCATHSGAFFTQILPSDNPGEIFLKVSENIPLLMSTESPMVEHGGEKFHTFNKVQADLNKILLASNQYRNVGSFQLSEEGITIQFWIRTDRLK